MATKKSKKIAIRSDMEGLHGVVDYSEVTPGAAHYEWGKARLHAELNALCEGLLAGGASGVEIYDEHFYGRNIEPDLLSSGVFVIRGKPPYREDWPGGLDSSFAGMIMQGLHAMRGDTTGLLAHTYEPEIQAIHINGDHVGEIGVETAIAAEAGVPLIMVTADSAGVREALAFQPGIETVVAKDALGESAGRCPDWKSLREEFFAKARRVAGRALEQDPVSPRYRSPVELCIRLKPGNYADALWSLDPQLRAPDNANVARLVGKSVTALWARYWQLKLQAQAMCLRPADQNP